MSSLLGIATTLPSSFSTSTVNHEGTVIDISLDVYKRQPSILNNVYPTYTILETTGQVLDLLVPVSSACCHASTSGLSTW